MIWSLISVLTMTNANCATPPSTPCAKYSQALEENLKLISLYSYGSVTGANQDNNRLLNLNGQLIQNNTLIQLLVQAKCPLPDGDLFYKYSSAASLCSLAKSTAEMKGEYKTPSECYTSDWKPNKQ
jgi:hypothetical protein